MVTGNIQLATIGFAHVPELPEALAYAPETDAGDPQADAAIDLDPITACASRKSRSV
jgi:hypothetical protein